MNTLLVLSVHCLTGTLSVVEHSQWEFIRLLS